jgi:PIN domain nuclease of toxin-antitoxin system
MVRTEEVTYLDTHIVMRLYEGNRFVVSPRAQAAIDRDDDLRISPWVLLELEYLHEIKRIKTPARRVVNSLETEIGLRVCDAPFPLVVHQALEERWTRDPFDRVIVAQARLQNAALITLDRDILEHYPHALS